VLAECGLPLAYLTRRTLERTRRQERREEDVEGQRGRGAGDVHAWLSNALWEWPLRPFNASLPDPLAGPRQPRRRELQAPWPVWRRAGEGPRGQGAHRWYTSSPRGEGQEGPSEGVVMSLMLLYYRQEERALNFTINSFLRSALCRH